MASAAACAMASGPNPVTDDLVRSLTSCSSPLKIERRPIGGNLPNGMKAELISTDGESAWCSNVMASVVLPDGTYYLGTPWFLDGFEGASEKKIRDFGWQRMHESLGVTVDPAKGPHGLHRAKITQKTDFGNIVTAGWVDDGGNVFIPGELVAPGKDLLKQRVSELAPVLAPAPKKGQGMSRLTVVEFSDFQCPSCKAAASWMKPLMARYGDKVQFVRVDLPLISHHPWAFPAALAGRAIYRQNPEVFWKYKDWVYANQDELSAFTIGDFARNFAADNSLDMKRYEADLRSDAIKSEIITGINVANSLNVRATPTFLVNGVSVDPGKNGDHMEQYIARALGTKK